MGKAWCYKMDIVLKNKNGFSMLEMLICICLISTLMLLTISNTNNLNLDHYYFLNDYLLSQSKAILRKDDLSIGKGITFNSMGHINQARTIEFGNHKAILHLGNGYATKE